MCHWLRQCERDHAPTNRTSTTQPPKVDPSNRKLVGKPDTYGRPGCCCRGGTPRQYQRRGPRPIGRPLAQAATNGVRVERVDRRKNRRRCEDIAVETSPLPPEPEAALPRPFPDGQRSRKRRLLGDKAAIDVAGNRWLDPRERAAEVRLTRQNKPVDLLEPVNKRHKLDLPRSPDLIDRLGQPPPPIPGECELMRMPQFMPSTNSSRASSTSGGDGPWETPQNGCPTKPSGYRCLRPAVCHWLRQCLELHEYGEVLPSVPHAGSLK